MAELALLCCMLTLIAGNGAYSSLWWAGFSLWWLLLLWSTGPRRVGFSSCGAQTQLPHGTWDLSSLTRGRTRVPCIGWSIPNHWTNREVPPLFIWQLFVDHPLWGRLHVGLGELVKWVEALDAPVTGHTWLNRTTPWARWQHLHSGSLEIPVLLCPLPSHPWVTLVAQRGAVSWGRWAIDAWSLFRGPSGLGAELCPGVPWDKEVTILLKKTQPARLQWLGRGLASYIRPETVRPIFSLGIPCWLLLLASLGVLLTLDLWAKSTQSIPLGISCGRLTQGWNVKHC